MKLKKKNKKNNSAISWRGDSGSILNRTGIKTLFFTLAAGLFAVTVSGQDKNSLKAAREGNRLYKSNEYIGAENAYRRSEEIDKTSAKIPFNLGNSLYRQEKYDEAGKEYEAALDRMTDKKDKAKAYYNLGNSLLKQQKIQESIEAYKQSLRNNPNDPETKQNLLYAMRMLQQQEQQQQNQDNQDQNQDQNQDKQDQQDQQNQDQQDQDQEQQQQQQQQEQEQQISPEDAQRILDAIAQDEKDLQEKLQKKERAGHRPKIEKNW
jgi:tetratricopeptide (TPR) repeat protein